MARHKLGPGWRTHNPRPPTYSSRTISKIMRLTNSYQCQPQWKDERLWQSCRGEPGTHFPRNSGRATKKWKKEETCRVRPLNCRTATTHALNRKTPWTPYLDKLHALLFGKMPNQAAATPFYAAVAPEIVGGQYYEGRIFFHHVVSTFFVVSHFLNNFKCL